MNAVLYLNSHARTIVKREEHFYSVMQAFSGVLNIPATNTIIILFSC